MYVMWPCICIYSYLYMWCIFIQYMRMHTQLLNTDGEHKGEEEPNIFEDSQLAFLVDPVLEEEDKNNDGFIDYPEKISFEGIFKSSANGLCLIIYSKKIS
eukprot:TRINITY_DN8507_c0_g2_i14.p1 TRINITY_DN8507_c0_g2~~TRINITY_DN8507_c0_g2_i14.p1  ORF type:complete len:100 (+),score=3.39 TRINITY_DN8507_c0_g2_i14:447-746(+)